MDPPKTVSLPNVRFLVLEGGCAALKYMGTSTWHVPRLESLHLIYSFGWMEKNEWSAMFGTTWQGILRLGLSGAALDDEYRMESDFWDTFPQLQVLSLPRKRIIDIRDGPPVIHPLRYLIVGRSDICSSYYLWVMPAWLAECPGVTRMKVRSSLGKAIRFIRREFFEEVLLKGVSLIDKDGVILTKDLLDTLDPPTNDTKGRR